MRRLRPSFSSTTSKPISARKRRDLLRIFALIFRAFGAATAAAIVATLAAISGAVSAGAVEVPFSAPIEIDSPDGARSVFAADLDGDGDTDVLATGGGLTTGQLVWYANDGAAAPAFTAHTIATTSGAVDLWSAALAADLDGDGDLDAISAFAVDGTVAWYENEGGPSPSFASTHVVSTDAESVRSVFAADLDGDGDLDLLSASYDDQTIAWYENDGATAAPSFTEHTITTSVPFGPLAVSAADLDEDGDLDVVAGESTRGFVWYENDGGSQPAFAEQTVDPFVRVVRSVSPADLDGDGDTDLVTAASGLIWYESDGGANPSFTPHTTSSGFYNVATVQAVDFDGDGDTDFVAATLNGSIRWLENDGASSPSFAPREIAEVGVAGAALAGDVDGDGDLDALTTSVTGDSLAWHRNDTIHRSVWLDTEVLVASPGVSDSVVAVDLDRDGDTDVVDATVSVRWRDNDGAAVPTFADRPISFEDIASSVVAADLDRDGDVDVASADSFEDTIAWHESDGAVPPAWTRHVVSTDAVDARSVAAANLDGDGDTDLLSASSAAILWHENDGAAAPSFTEHTISTDVLGGSAVVAADLDGDGDLDALSASADDETIAWHENDGGAPPAFTSYPIDAAARRARSVFAGDLDGDGDLDVLGASDLDGTFTWYENPGSGVASAFAFTQHTLGTTAARPSVVSAADLDGDGDLDVITATSTPVADDQLAWWENDGASDPQFTPHTLVDVIGSHVSLTGADLDGDGDLDVVAAGSPTRVSWLPNRGGQVALPTIDVAQKVLAGGQLEDLLAIDLVHRGRAGDTDVELAALELRFADGAGQALGVAEVQALVASLVLYLDDGDGTLSGADTAVASLATDDVAFTLDGDGALVWILPDGAPNLRAAFGAPRRYLLAVETTADAELQDPSALQVTHVLPDFLTDPFGVPVRTEDADRDLALRLEPSADVGTGPIDTELTSTSCRAPFDLVLVERTVVEAVICEAGLEIRAGASVRVETTGALTLRAGRTVRLSSGFSVASGGALQIVIDESLEQE